ncbi:glycoside hydrolase family 6 protein [Demequina zhanjiangensis]|uniref:Glucanase n=1 Tax=Demequina zhanjiangensis TaxID=3051659 RepID=A0ABT8FZ75_9MICO|nr:glycoside hydrolase family 6 protein [Demequina sp. SYSU T00b26]MDN4472201.1 glycoside hydrolase family 6 protein [Demequina sp. SYSU T00b26]
MDSGGTQEEAAPAASSFYRAPGSADVALQRAREEGRDTDAELIDRIASQPIGVWLNGGDGAVAEAAAVSEAATAAGEIALFVVYNIPGRDCGLYSAGGAAEDEYLGWVSQVAQSLADGGTTWVILEPDGLASLGDCDGQGDRVSFLAGAAAILDEAGAEVFLDVGHSGWRAADDTASRIQQVGTEHLAGFATNTSNYNATADEQAWADQVAAAVGLPYVTDTSRNGNGSNGEWCNPRGRALGENPGLTGATEGLIARVWAKVPGESDGTCNGGPAAGQWWEDVALELARNAS